jgi:hypothetical protein
MKKKLLPIILAILVIAGGSFYGGFIYANHKSPASRLGQNNFPDGNFRRSATGQNTGQAGANFINGEIISKDNTSLTVKLRDGGSKIVFFADTTEVVKSITGSLDDLQVGDTIMVTGSTNQEGSLTAQNIQLRPVMVNASSSNSLPTP